MWSPLVITLTNGQFAESQPSQEKWLIFNMLCLNDLPVEG